MLSVAPGRDRGRRLGVARPGGLARAGGDPPGRAGALRRAADHLAAGAGGRAAPAAPVLKVAAGDGGRAAVTWQFGGSAGPKAPLHVRTAAPTASSAPIRRSPARAGYADVGLAVAPTAPSSSPTSTSTSPATSRLEPARRAGHGRRAALRARRRSPRAARARAPATQVATASPPDGSATVAWAKPGATLRGRRRARGLHPRRGRRLRRRADRRPGAAGHLLAAGPAGSAALAWMQETQHPKSVSYAIHASTRPGRRPVRRRPDHLRHAINGLWPSVAMTPRGDAIAAWVTNTDGSGGGSPRALPTALRRMIRVGRWGFLPTRAGCFRACAGARARAW